MKLLTLLFHDLFERDPTESGFLGAAADRYKMSVSAFDRQLEAIRCERPDAPILVTGADETVNVARTPYAITVDDGGLSYMKLADRLEEQGWRGHCFVTTGCIGRRGFLESHHLRELHARGHLIGSHSVSHPPLFNRLPWRKQVEEWHKSRAVLEDLIGAAVKVASVPGGFYSEGVARAAQDAGIRALFTSEPERRLRRVDGCLVLGRYTLRRDSPPGLAGRLVRQEPALLAREWLVWNAKKALKGSLGSGYIRLSGWLQRGHG